MCVNELTYRDEEGNKFFSPLQEKSSRDEYGGLLGRLVYFYLRQSDQESATWKDKYPLAAGLQESLDHLKHILADREASSEAIQTAFDKVLVELFLWEEREGLIDEMACPNNIFPALYPLKPAYSGGVASVIYKDKV